MLTRLSLVIGVVAVAAIAMAASRQPSRGGVEQRVEDLLKKMTLTEKIELLGGVEGFYLRGVPRLNLPKMKMADGPFGVKNNGPSTAMAAGIGLAATWNPSLAERVGREIGRDARARGVHFLLGPGVNIYTAPMNGRNFEYFGEDPLLAGRMAVGYITGVQSQGVSATVKHFLGNNSEFDRHGVDVIVDERTLREIYLPAFEAAVKDARVGAIMTSYNLVNGQHMSQYGAINNDIVKKEWGFDGVIMSDWTSTYDTLAAANAGLDVEMPSGAFLNEKALLPLIKAGKVSEATIDDKARRILRLAVRFGWLDRDQTDKSIPRDNPEGRAAALASAREAMVLLKNDGAVLPLDRARVKTVAIIGPRAEPAVWVGGGSAAVQPHAAVSFREGLTKVGGGVKILHHRALASVTELADRTAFTVGPKGGEGLEFEGYNNIDLSGAPAVTRVDRRINIAAPFFPGSDRANKSSARWSGYFTAPKAGAYHMAVETTRGDGGYRVFVDNKMVLDAWRLGQPLVSHVRVQLTAGPHRVRMEQYRREEWGNAATRLGIVAEDAVVDAAAIALAKQADVVIAAVGYDTESEGEASDRTFALPIGQDELIDALVRANPKTVVTITSGGGVDMTRWIDRVPAVIANWYPGQEGGIALADLVFGNANFSGRLPVSFERQLADNPSFGSYYPAPGSTKVEYKNGVFVGYRGYEQNKRAPLFPFGHGLSYTEFAYSNLRASKTASGVDVTFEVKNTGAREGADVPQIYVAEMKPSIARPPKELRGFSKVSLKPGESRTVTIALGERAFSYFDPATHRWRANPGTFELLLGSSSAQTPLKIALTR